MKKVIFGISALFCLSVMAVAQPTMKDYETGPVVSTKRTDIKGPDYKNKYSPTDYAEEEYTIKPSADRHAQAGPDFKNQQNYGKPGEGKVKVVNYSNLKGPDYKNKRF